MRLKMLLADQTILITGAAKRIGRALALAAAREGANLIIHHNQSLSEAKSLQTQIHSLDRSAVIYQADFSIPAEAQAFAQDVFSSNQVDAVINNASIFADHDWASTTVENWTRHMDVNLLAPFLISQSFARLTPAGKKGRIINLLDWRALRPGRDHLPYTVSKAGLASLTKSLALSLAPDITVNGIALGAILPPSDGGEVEDLVSSLPNPRWAEMRELEETMVFLLSGPAYITGEIIHLDGGRHLI
jgi:NAD(P)-dependent dehydrogenase (short-subunit alcohol dehydrogenase family)